MKRDINWNLTGRMGRCPKPHRGGSSSPDPASGDSLLDEAEQLPRPSNLDAKNRSRAGQQSWPTCALCAQEKQADRPENEQVHFPRLASCFSFARELNWRHFSYRRKLFGLRFALHRQPASLQLSSPGRKRVSLPHKFQFVSFQFARAGACGFFCGRGKTGNAWIPS